MATARSCAPFIASERAVGVLGDGVEQLYWSAEHRQLKYQLGDGCLIDQVLGQWHARLYGLGDVFDPRQVASRPAAPSTATTSSPRLGDIYNPCRVFGLDDEVRHDHRHLAGPSAQAGRAGALRPGDDARHGVRVRPAADGLRHARRGRRRSPRRSATATTAPSATPGTRSSAARTTPARWRAGARSSCSPASRFDAGRGQLGFAPRRARRRSFASVLVGPAGLRHVRARRRRGDARRPRRRACASARLGLPLGGGRRRAVQRRRRGRVAFDVGRTASCVFDGVAPRRRRRARGRRARDRACRPADARCAIDDRSGARSRHCDRCGAADDRLAPPRPAADLPRRRLRDPRGRAVRLLPVPQRRRDVRLLGAARRRRDPVHAVGRGVLGSRRRRPLHGGHRRPGSALSRRHAGTASPTASTRPCRLLWMVFDAKDVACGQRPAVPDARDRGAVRHRRRARRRRSTCPRPACRDLATSARG